jgi:hypothetical protein
MADINQADPKFMDFMFTGLDHGINSIKDGSGPLIPFVMTSLNGEKKLSRFVADSYEDSMMNASEHIMHLNPVPDYALLAYDGFITMEGKKYDAIIVQAYDKTLDEGFVFAQRYIPKNDDQEFESIGNAAFIGKEQNLLTIHSANHGTKDIKTENSSIDKDNKPWWKIW